MAKDPFVFPEDPDELRKFLGEDIHINRLLTNHARIIDIDTRATKAKGWRIDKFLSALFTNMTRSMLQRWCKNGWVTVNGKVVLSRHIIQHHQHIHIEAPLPPPPKDAQYTAPPLSIVYQGPDFLVCNKPPGQLAHQAGRVLSGTLLNQLQDWQESQGGDPQGMRLINRIDKDTSGIVLAACNSETARNLSDSLQAHQLKKIYYAICVGAPSETHGHWRDPIADNPDIRTKKCIAANGQESHTEYFIEETAPNNAYALLRIRLHTGRQHQIRIHAAHNGHPLVGDWMYGEPCVEIGGQALHAAELHFPNPHKKDNILEAKAPLHPIIAQLWKSLKAGAQTQPCAYTDKQRSQLGLNDAKEQNSWRKPSWLSDEDFQKILREQNS